MATKTELAKDSALREHARFILTFLLLVFPSCLVFLLWICGHAALAFGFPSQIARKWHCKLWLTFKELHWKLIEAWLEVVGFWTPPNRVGVPLHHPPAKHSALCVPFTVVQGIEFSIRMPPDASPDSIPFAYVVRCASVCIWLKCQLSLAIISVYCFAKNKTPAQRSPFLFRLPVFDNFICSFRPFSVADNWT